jgi:quercetin dioxygenase-like cupin family protein
MSNYPDKPNLVVQPEEIEIEPVAAAGGFFDIATLPGFSPLDGIQMSVLSGGRMMANWVRIEPGAVVPDHAHPHEQLGLVLEGEIDMTIDGETRRLGPGSAYVVPGGVRHAGQGGSTGCLVLDVFSPPREDYLSQAEPTSETETFDGATSP